MSELFKIGDKVTVGDEMPDFPETIKAIANVYAILEFDQPMVSLLKPTRIVPITKLRKWR